MTSALFGILQLDRGEPLGLHWDTLAGLAQAWLQDAGGFAAVGLGLYFLYVLFGERTAGVVASAAARGRVPVANPFAALAAHGRMSESNKIRMPVTTWMVTMYLLSLVCYVGFVFLVILGKGAAPEAPLPMQGLALKVEPPTFHREARPLVLAVAGLFALLGIGEPFARDLLKVRGRRLWALSKLGFKEALRFRLQYVFLIILLPFLFRNVWMANTRPADEFRSLVWVASDFTTYLVLVVAVLLTSFSIPNDIKNLTIHTVVTKPVERFEIVLGRFLGYTALMTIALAAMTAVNLLLINTATIDAKAEAEAAKARVPVHGKLEFRSRKADFDGTNVGREFDYRRYIAGHPDSPQRAIWHFAAVPGGMTTPPGDWVPVEFTFDLYRMTKGVENQGGLVTFRFVTHAAPQAIPRPEQKGEWQWGDLPAEERGAGEARRAAYAADLAALPPGTAEALPGSPGWAALSQLADKHGFFEIRNKEVFDYAVMGVEVPGGLFRNAARGTPPVEDGKPRPRFSIYVKCESGGQMLGMAEPDLYLLESNQPFTVNFVKGTIGLWCRLCIVIGIAVACSTYLSGVLSLLVTVLIFLLGNMTEHLSDLANNRAVGGGPFEALTRMVKTDTPTTQLAETAGTKTLQYMDQWWAWVFRRVQNVIPDVNSFTWTQFVSEGFNINAEYLLMNLLMTAGYLLPWGVLAYYLMKSREVAS